MYTTKTLTHVVVWTSAFLLHFVAVTSSSNNNVDSRCSFENQRVECGSLSCDPVLGQCVPCTNASQCHEAVMQCSTYGECEVGSVASTFSSETLVSLLITILVCAIAVVAGLGGGGILVPTYAALIEMPLIASVGLSQAAICGQSTLNMLYQIPKTVPTNSPMESRPLINYQYLAILLPLSFIGTLLGSLGGKVVPDWLRLALLFLLLTSVLHRVIEKARKQYNEDKADRLDESNKKITNVGPPPSLVIRPRTLAPSSLARLKDENASRSQLLKNDDEKNSIAMRAVVTDDDAYDITLDDYNNHNNNNDDEEGGERNPIKKDVASRAAMMQKIDRGDKTKESDSTHCTSSSRDRMDDEERNATSAVSRGSVTLRVPQREITLLVVSFTVLLVCNIARSLFTTCGSTAFVLLLLFPIVALIALAWLAKRMAATTLANVAQGFLSPDHMTFHWNQNTMVWFPLAALVAGAAAAMLGIGGGLVLSFVLFEAGLAPEEASATSGFATLLIASESALLMIFQGQLVPDYAVMFFLCGVVSTVFGQSVLMAYIRRNKMKFLIVVALAIIIGGSLVMLTSYGLFQVVELYKRQDGSLFAFGHVCSRRQN